MSKLPTLCAFSLALAAALTTAPATAAETYAGKSIELIVGAPPAQLGLVTWSEASGNPATVSCWVAVRAQPRLSLTVRVYVVVPVGAVTVGLAGERLS